MSKTTIGWAIAITLLGGLFCFGAATTLQLRADFSDAYAPYSSYRPDPIGTRAFYAALHKVPGLRVERNEMPLQLLKGDATTALLFLGVAETPDPLPSIERVENLVRVGGRLVLSFGMRGQGTEYTLTEDDARALRDETESAEEQIRRLIKREKIPAITPPQDTDWGDGSVLASERWGFRVVVPEAKEQTQDDETDNLVPPMGLRKIQDFVATASPTSTLPKSLVCKSEDYLLPLDDRWTPLYSLSDDRVVMMERHFGKGTIVVASDSFFVSNEAQRKAPQGELLAFLVGTKPHVLFDESSKGIDRSPGIVALMKRYHLHVVMAVAVLLALLYAWRASVSLVPRRTQEEEQIRALLLQGRDANDGLAALLRRAIAPGRLLETCLQEWAQTHARTDPTAKKKMAQAKTLLATINARSFPKIEEEFARDYMALAAVLHDRRTKS